MIISPKEVRQSCRTVAGNSIVGLLTLSMLCGCKAANSAGDIGAPRAHAASTVRDGTYVALGDSYTAAPLVRNAESTGCLRSDDDYPQLVANALRPRSFIDASCYGASTFDMSHPQATIGTINPPQLNGLSAVDSLVTVQVGGDDIGFGRIVTTCGALSLTDPFGSPCKDHYSDGGDDQLAQAVARTAPKIAAVLKDIRLRAPAARILVIGYPDILPGDGHGCWPWVPLARGDVPYLRSLEISLNAMLAATATTAGDGFIDVYRGTVGHDACQPTGVKWVEGLIPTSLAVPIHPNVAGEKAMARLILSAVR